MNPADSLPACIAPEQKPNHQPKSPNNLTSSPPKPSNTPIRGRIFPVMAANIPTKLKTADLTRFIVRAAQLENARPVISYWCTWSFFCNLYDLYLIGIRRILDCQPDSFQGTSQWRSGHFGVYNNLDGQTGTGTFACFALSCGEILTLSTRSNPIILPTMP